MDSYGDNVVLFSQLLSGVLLFDREISDIDLLTIMSSYENLYKKDIVDDEFNIIYDFIYMSDTSISIKTGIKYDSIIDINGEKMSLRKCLVNNTTYDVLSFLSGVYDNKIKEESKPTNYQGKIKKKLKFIVSFQPKCCSKCKM